MDREYKPEIHNLESFDYKLADEFKEYARYLRLSYLKEMRLIEDSEKPELEKLIKSNRRAESVERARELLRAGVIEPEDYFIIYNAYKKQLMDAIIEANKEREKETEEEIDEEDNLELPEMLAEYARFKMLTIRREKGIITDEEDEELDNISMSNEFAITLLQAKKMLDEHKMSLEAFNRVKDILDRELMEANKVVTARKNKKNQIPEKEQEKKEVTEEEELNKLEQDILDYGNEKVVGNPEGNKNNTNFDPIKNDPLLNFIYDTFNGEKNGPVVNEVKDGNKLDTELETSQENKKGKEEDINDLARFFNLRSSRAKNGLLTLEENDEYDAIVCRNERAFEIEKADLEYKYNKISKDEYNDIINKHKDYLIEAMNEYKLTKKVDEEKVEAPATKEAPVHKEPVEEHDGPVVDDDDMLRVMRETVDHYMAYKKGLNKLGVANMHELMELLATKGKTTEEEGPTHVKK